MKMYFDMLLSEIKNNPSSVFIGMCVFVVAVMGTSVHHVASTSFALLFISSLFIVKEWESIWRNLSKNEKWLLIGFGLYFVSGLLSYINVQDIDEYIRALERYVRFLVAIPIYFLLKKHQIKIVVYLYVGAIVSGPFLFLIAISNYIENPNIPAHGDYHHIIFGGIAMLNVGIMLSILLTKNLTIINKLIVIVAIICGLIAAVLSQSRGVWLVLPLYFLIAIYYAIRHSKINIYSMVAGVVLMATIIALSPISNMIEKRVNAAIDEVSTYYSDDNYVSSLGTRLAMWDISIDVWKDNPLLGTGPGDFDDEIRLLQKNGQYKGMDVFGNTHNIYFQALVNTGIVGFVILVFTLFFVPIRMIFSANEGQSMVKLSGIVFVVFFAVFGLGESWTIRLSIASVYIIYLMVLASSISDNTSSNELNTTL